MNKYQNGKVYKTVDVGYKKCYIGSTCESLNQRMARHRSKYAAYLNGKVEHTRSFYLFDEFGVDNCKIELIEHYPCDEKDELRKREGEYIRATECVNKQVAGRTHKQYYEENKEICIRKCREYNTNNREKVACRIKEYARKHKREVQEYKKQYQQEHRQEIKEYMQNYYKTNKAKILSRQGDNYSKTYMCECGSACRLDGKSKHEKTMKHQLYKSNLEK